MARPKKNNAEYFTHDADMRNDVKIMALRRKFRHEGYAVWNFLLETLTDSDFFEIEWEEISIELLAADYDVSVERLTDIVDYCVKIGLLQQEGNRLYSAAHQKRFATLLANRARKRTTDSNGDIIPRQNPAETPQQPETAEQNDIVKDNKGKETKGKERYPYQDIADLWNRICVSLPKISKLSDARRAKIKSRLQEFGKPEAWLPTVETLFEAIEASDFLRGVNKNKWQASFDWVFANGSNWVKVLEGNYANKGQQGAISPAGVTLGVGERIENGRRTYGTGAATIPMTAPPRPSERYAWDKSTQNWVML